MIDVLNVNFKQISYYSGVAIIDSELVNAACSVKILERKHSAISFWGLFTYWIYVFHNTLKNNCLFTNSLQVLAFFLMGCFPSFLEVLLNLLPF